MTQTVTPFKAVKTDRSLAAIFFLGLLTFGIYPTVIFCQMSEDINWIASKYDQKRTTNFCLMSIFSALTFGIYAFYWYHTFSARIGDELKRRGINYSFGASDFWLWNILGSLIWAGPFVYTYKMCKAMNLLGQHYNTYRGM